MMNRIATLLLILIGAGSMAQGIKYLPANINMRGKQTMFPAISGDGKTMIFLSNYTNDGDLAVMITNYQGGRWENFDELPNIGPESVNNLGGYTLSNDGETIWFSSKRPNGVGAYDLWYMTKNGSSWNRPLNPGIPVNSAEHEGNPSISPDGQRLYFMKCTSISREAASGCKLYYSDRNYMPGERPWETPVELPVKLNQGNTQSPRILSDNRTLLFASDRPGGKGGFDIWMSKREGDDWSDPVNVSFVNTEEDEFFITFSLRNDIAYYTRKNPKGFDAIVEGRVPEQYRPDNVVMMIGKLQDESSAPLGFEARLNDYQLGSLETRVKTDPTDGSFIAVMPEGSVYELTFEDRSGDKTFHSEIVDAEELVGSRRTYPTYTLKDVKAGVSFPVNGVTFIDYSSQIEEYSSFEISRLSRLLRRHNDLKVEIAVYQEEYEEDTFLSGPDLTEIMVDTVKTYETPIHLDSLSSTQKDSLLTDLNDTLMHSIADTTIANMMLARMAGSDSVEVVKYTYTYHNDRTQEQAEALKEALIQKGVPEDRITCVGRKDNESPFPFMRGFDRNVVVTFLED